LLERGWEPEEFTKTGNPKVDKAVLEALADDVNTPQEVSWLVSCIMSAKRAKKWKTAYAEAMLKARDPWDRVHPDINALQARTGRMSIGNPPLQQLPSRGDDAWIIRRQVIAREGYVIGSADYDQVEFRVLAALADVSQMKYAIANDIDLHDYTAQLVYGEDFTNFQRSVCKGVGFGKVFGGGAKTLSRQTGAPIDKVREAISAYDAAYFELPRYAKSLQREQRMNGGFIVNYHGRYLPLDNGREYAAVNYSVQSIARDLLAQALIDLAKAGLDEYLLLPVHDEVLFEAPEEDALDIAHEVGNIMSGTFIDVPISATGEIYGKSWANGYVVKGDDGVVRSKGTKNPIKDWVEP
jgi:DNA polymerase-1